MRRQSPRITDSDDSGVPSSCAAPDGEQADADDMLLLGRLLAQVGEMRVARAQVAVDPRDEQHQQHRDQREADPHALTCSANSARGRARRAARAAR